MPAGIFNRSPAHGTVNEVPLGGGTVTTLATGQREPWFVAVDSTHIYWANYGDEHIPDGSVDEVPLGGGNATTLASHQHPEILTVGP